MRTFAIHSQEALRIARLPLRHLRTALFPTPHSTRPPFTSSHLTQRCHRPTPIQPTPAPPLQPQSPPTFQLALESEHLLPLLSHLSFGSFRLELALTI